MIVQVSAVAARQQSRAMYKSLMIQDTVGEMDPLSYWCRYSEPGRGMYICHKSRAQKPKVAAG